MNVPTSRLPNTPEQEPPARPDPPAQRDEVHGGASRLTEEHSFEFHRSGGSVEPAEPEELARQEEDAAGMTPVGPRSDLRRGLEIGVACGVVLALVMGLIGLAPLGFADTWPRVGILAAIGLLGGLTYGTLLGAARRAR